MHIQAGGKSRGKVIKQVLGTGLAGETEGKAKQFADRSEMVKVVMAMSE